VEESGKTEVLGPRGGRCLLLLSILVLNFKLMLPGTLGSPLIQDGVSTTSEPLSMCPSFGYEYYRAAVMDELQNDRKKIPFSAVTMSTS
jgi:hypothetical protein